ncbi:hypothetical protein CMI47_21510 [Candidatus Pacearchaeota archaeon]|jgi:predicted RNA-binding Zn-ribbon protein involved in translation (DUF1610 family)|nr:hypothetical protein [Candidatus Pacearchaeota archaeon]|tara:strand:+ start:2179 stop:2685 length:507 start_codon:yes stop_codon:yes gene_type:complete
MNQQAIYDIRQEEDWDFNELTDEDRKKCAEFDKANGLDKPPHLDMILQDAYDGDRKLQAKAVHERHGIGVTIKGYGDALTEDSHGSPIFIENRNGKLFVCIWADINQEDPTHVIDMSEALENNRKESEETKYCRRCGTKLQIEKELDYPYYCPECDENMYEFETENRK